MDPFIRQYRNDDYNTIVVEKVDEVNKLNINEMFNILQMNIRSIQMNFEEFQVGIPRRDNYIIRYHHTDGNICGR